MKTAAKIKMDARDIFFNISNTLLDIYKLFRIINKTYASTTAARSISKFAQEGNIN